VCVLCVCVCVVCLSVCVCVLCVCVCVLPLFLHTHTHIHTQYHEAIARQIEAHERKMDHGGRHPPELILDQYERLQAC
jgi:Ca2+/H+ antiporter